VGLKVGSPTVKDQTYITPGLACACGLYLGDPSARSTIEVVAEELGPSLRWATAGTTRTTRNQHQ
jgi:hypothetical protein